MNVPKEVIFGLVVVAAVGSGLLAGLFFAFSNFVMKALQHQPPESGVRTMQSINAFIQNPGFFALFLGTTLAAAAVVVMSVLRLGHPGFDLQLAGAALYLVGTFAVTVLVHVPLNNRLAHVHPSGADMPQFWSFYVSKWVMWNHVRTVNCMLATALLVMAVEQSRQAGG